MNIIEALEVALPELPARSAKKSYPKLDHRVIHKEHIEQGFPVVLAKMPGSDTFVSLSPAQWQLLQYFNGERSYAEVARLYEQETGAPTSEADIIDSIGFLVDQTDLFYKTPLEKNVMLKQKLGDQRHKHRRFKLGDVTDITIYTWPKVDRYITQVHEVMKFMYTNWFVGLTLLAFTVMFWMWWDKLGQIWIDSFLFYKFTAKGFGDLVEFWVLFGAMAFCHEYAHGMTCKHFGGNVEKIQFIIMYFSPTFVCDVTQIWVIGGKKARLATAIAGIWVDLILCVFATVIWWGTATGMWIHEICYKIMMVTGIGVTLLNLNPLIKLDGYYIFSELTGECDLKERATAYLSGWVRKTIFRLPVEVEYVRRSRRAFYLIYAILSGVYSYLLIVLVVVFSYNVFKKYSPEWAIVPVAGIGYLMFKGRLKLLGRFMRTLYLDKRDRARAWLTPPRQVALGAALVLLLVLPIWPDFIEAAFILEPSARSMVRTQVGGTVAAVYAEEGQAVSPGTPLVRLRNLDLESAAAKAHADAQVAVSRATQAQLQYAGFGAAEQQRRELAARYGALSDQVAQLNVNSPIAGVVVTPRVRDLLGSRLDAGAQIAEVADVSSMLARVYIPEYAMHEIRVGTRTRLQVQGRLVPLTGSLESVAPVSSHAEEGLLEKELLTGINAPHFYVGTVRLANDGRLREGETGTAKIFVRRRSVVAFVWRFGRDLVDRRLW